MITNAQRIDNGATSKSKPRWIGTGVPANSDALVVDTVRNGKGTTYYDLTSHQVFMREATAGVAADFVTGVNVQTPDYAATISLTTVSRTTRLLPAQLVGAVTINAVVTNAVAGDVLIYGAGADGTNRVTTFGTNFKSAGTLTCTASKYVGATFVFDGTYWIETGRAITT